MALIHDAVGALRHHALQLLADRPQSRKASLDIGQLLAGDPVGSVTGTVRLARQALQGAQVIQAKTQIATMPDETQLLQMRRPVTPLASG